MLKDKKLYKCILQSIINFLTYLEWNKLVTDVIALSFTEYL